MLLRFIAALGELDAAALAASAHMNLRFYDDNPVARTEELLRRGIGLLKGDGDLPVGHAYAITAEDLFGLILVNLQCALREPVAQTKP